MSRDKLSAKFFGFRLFANTVEPRCRALLQAACLVFAALPLLLAQAAPIDMHAAARAGDAQALELALNSGADVNGGDDWGRTPLIVALQQGKARIVEMLLARGASVAATDAWGRTPLLVAAQLKNTAAVRLLLDKKSDVNAANRNDITALIAAAQTGNREAAAMLLAAGAATDREDNLGRTALMWAAFRKDGALVKMLLDHGAAAGTVGRDNLSALDLATSRAADPMLIALLEAAMPCVPATRPDARAGRSAAAKDLLAAAGPKVSPAIDASRIVRGNARAAITLFEYTDFQCPYCRYGAMTLDEVMARYEGQIRLMVKHLPLPLLHPMAMSCALHFEAISLQSTERAWAFYDQVFADQNALAGGESYLRKVAADLGVDLSRLEQDLSGPIASERVNADLKESREYKFDGVPAFVVNGYIIRGAQPAQKFFDLIDAVLHN